MAVHYYTYRHYHPHSERTTRTVQYLEAASFLWLIVAIVEAVLLLRFGLRLLGANPAAPFAGLIYSAADILLTPFRSLLPAARTGRSVFEWTTLFAAFVYWLMAWLVVRFLARSEPRVATATKEKIVEVA